MHQDPGERRSDPIRFWPRLAHECPGILGRGKGQWWPAAGLGTLSAAVCTGPFEGGCHYLHYLHHSLASGPTTGRERNPAHQQEIGLKIYWAWLCPTEQDPVSPSVSLSHQQASISFLSLAIRGTIIVCYRKGAQKRFANNRLSITQLYFFSARLICNINKALKAVLEIDQVIELKWSKQLMHLFKKLHGIQKDNTCKVNKDTLLIRVFSPLPEYLVIKPQLCQLSKA